MQRTPNLVPSTWPEPGCAPCIVLRGSVQATLLARGVRGKQPGRLSSLRKDPAVAAREVIALAIIILALIAALTMWRARGRWRQQRKDRHRRERIDLLRDPPPGL